MIKIYILKKLIKFFIFNYKIEIMTNNSDEGSYI